MYQRLKSHPYALYGLACAVLVVLFAATHMRRVRRPCMALHAAVYPAELRFVSQEQLVSMMDRYARRPLIGQSTHHLNLHAIERRLAADAYVKDVELYRLHSGDLATRVWQREPLVRLSPPRLPDVYLTKRGELLALSDEFTARVPVFYLPAGYPPDKAARWIQASHPQHGVFRFLRRLSADPFWRAQIATLAMDREQELLLYPQLSRQRVYFGMAEEVEEKLEKLQFFYTHILPQKGWNRYQRVDLRFRNQIVCQ